MTIATDFIKTRIKELGYTYAGVAHRAEISIHTLRKMLSGEYGTPSQYTRKRLAKVLEADESVIFLKTDIS